MKKILVLTEEFRAMTNANGICTKAIVDVLAKKNDVQVLSIIDSFKKDLPNEFDGIKVHYQNNVWWELKTNPEHSHFIQNVEIAIRKFRSLLMKPFFPFNSISPIVRFYFNACRLHEKNNFDIVLCFFHPFESFIVGSLLKKKYPKLKVVHYMLDSLSNYTPHIKLLSKEFCHRRYLKMETWGYTNCDSIINLQVQKKFYNSNPRYDRFLNKMKYADIPLFKHHREGYDLKVKKGMLVYAGSLVREFRNPSYALRLLSLLPHQYKSFFYSSGDCNDMVHDYARKYKTIVEGGYIQHNLLEKQLEDAEVLINIGNYKLNMIPSKIFEYFSYEKKIIHFYKDDGDTCLPYLKKYPYVILIDERDSIEKNLSKLISFLSKKIDPRAESDWYNSFDMNTPEYSAELVLEENDTL